MEDRLEMAQWIVNAEARRDARGHIALYNLPANDGGGTKSENREYAGINSRYDGKILSRIIPLVEAGKHAEAEAMATEYIAGNTDIAGGWTKFPAVELFLRDCVFNRGAGGAAKILQMAVGTKPDGAVGPITKAAVVQAERFPELHLCKLRMARENYENIIAPGRPNMRGGLIARWDSSFSAAIQGLQLVRSA